MKSRGKKSRPNPPARAAAAPPPPLSRGRLWWFRLVALSLPFLFLLLVELGLRLAGQGWPTNFFQEYRGADGRRYVRPNEQFSLRFFPPELARWPTSFRFPAEKPPDTLRIFVFGESAAMGDPQPAYGASRYLDRLLRHRFPGQKLEVINLGITAINSHVILPIARECAQQHGDIWIIYMGNNEMVGPFGASTVFGARALPRSAVRLNLAIQQTYLGQWLAARLRNLGGKPKNTSWGGMQMFLENQIRPDDPRRETVYRNFEANLRDIVDAGLEGGAKVILSTMSVNLGDCPPFASLANTNRPVADQERFRAALAEGRAFQQQSNYAKAEASFAAACAADDQYAEAHFRRAQCLLALSNSAAPVEFQRACDTDALPFRADTRVNSAIRALAQARAAQGLVLSDAEAELAAASAEGVAGRESFYEHVHFNLAGNYRLGRAWGGPVAKWVAGRMAATSGTDWADAATCDRELGLGIWNRQFLTQSVLRRMGQPPLSTQFNNPERLAVVAAADRELLRQQALPGAAQQAGQAFLDVIRLWPEDPFLHEGFANFLEAIGDGKRAAAEYARMLELLPHDFYASLQWGRLLGERGELEQAQPLLEDATRLRPGLPEAWHELGVVIAAQGRFGEALGCMQRAEQLRPSDPTYVCYTGKVLAKLSRRAEAITQYEKAIRMRPEYWEARFELAGELAGDNRVNDAAKEYVEVLKINPRHALTRVNLGVMLVRGNKLAEAMEQFEAALQLEPTNRLAQDYLSQVRARAAKPR